MRCALCGDFLKYSAGMQCEDCKYTCHKKCYSKVVTKCISKSNAETDPDEEKLNHRIPHRFEHFSNMGANWCCHCGYILPLGRKNKKCSGKFRSLVEFIYAKSAIRVRPKLPRTLCSSGTRFLRHVNGGCKPGNQSHSRNERQAGPASCQTNQLKRKNFAALRASITRSTTVLSSTAKRRAKHVTTNRSSKVTRPGRALYSTSTNASVRRGSTEYGQKDNIWRPGYATARPTRKTPSICVVAGCH